MTKALRGINLGGWLVTERWMTPQLFEGLAARDEWSLRASDPGEAQERLRRHREEFITKEDIAAIAEAGFTFVRVPVGYWLWREVDGYLYDPDIVDRLFEWCQQHGLKVVISLHGAPGSQNGWDHSGQIGTIHWHESENIELTLNVLELIVQKYGRNPALLGVGLLNEPHPSLNLETIVEYYRAGHDLVHKYAHKSVRTIVSDSFRPTEMKRALRAKGLGDVVLDIHLYRVFDSKYRELSFEQHIAAVQNDWKQLLRECSVDQDVIVGEWSAMLDSEIFSGLSDQTRRGMVKYFYETQKQAFNSMTWGWSYWSYKTGGESVWNWRAHSSLALD